MVTSVSSVVIAESLVAIGAVLVARTLIVTVAVAGVPPLPSLIVYWKVSWPSKAKAGVYVRLPLVLKLTRPLVGSTGRSMTTS